MTYRQAYQAFENSPTGGKLLILCNTNAIKKSALKRPLLTVYLKLPAIR